MGGALTILNSTISGNNSSFGAALHNNYIGTVGIGSSTITGNSGGGDGAISNLNELAITNSIIGGNSGLDCVTLEPQLVTAVYSLFEDTGDAACGLAAALRPDSEGNLVGLAPLLGPLADNGGPTLTHAPLVDSPAIDRGRGDLAVGVDGSPLLTDQRGAGYARILLRAVDMGAVEYQPVCGAFAMSAGSEPALNAAIACFNTATTAGTRELTLTADIPVFASTMTIDNPRPGVALLIKGAGFDVYRTMGIREARLFKIARSTTVTMENITIRDGATGGEVQALTAWDTSPCATAP